MIKSTITAVLLSSVALVPAATIALVASVDAVEAKSNNGNGGGKGNQAGNSSSAKSKSDSKTASRSSSAGNGNSKASRSGNDPIGNFLRKVTGQEKKATTTTKTKRAATTTKVAKTAKVKDGTHPSNLGKMNGALNANTNAIIAHVKNGNTNGPIGGMAALAVAGYAAEGAADTLELDGKFTKLDAALIENGYVDEDGNADIDGYLAAIEGVPGNGENEAIEDALTNIDSELTIEEALKAENNGVQDFATIEDYEAWRDGVDGADPIDGADDLIAELDGLERPSENDVEFANDRIADQTSAEDNILSIWNKGDGDDTVRSEEEVALLEQLYERIEADGDALKGAIEKHADLPEAPIDEDMTSCGLEDGCEEVTEEDMVAIAE